MVNIYLKEDKYFRVHSDRIRKICGGVKHLTMSNSVETQQCSNELGIVFAASSFFASGHTNRGEERKNEDLEYLAAINYEILE